MEVMKRSQRIHATWAMVAVLCLILGIVIGQSLSKRAATGIVLDGNACDARCTRVIDGDTIVVSVNGVTEKVRLLGIDAPEPRRHARLPEQAKKLGVTEEAVLALGNRATDKMISLVQGKRVNLVFPQREVSRDSFGRLLCYVEVDGVDVGERMLLFGLATLYETKHPRGKKYAIVRSTAQRTKTAF